MKSAESSRFETESTFIKYINLYYISCGIKTGFSAESEEKRQNKSLIACHLFRSFPPTLMSSSSPQSVFYRASQNVAQPNLA